MARHTDDFAARLRDLKDRSGRSYGALAQRLHTSTSTLHRYCNGTTVPAEFAPAERFARACGATPEEVLALHRLWLLADAERRAEGSGGRGELASEVGGGDGDGSAEATGEGGARSAGPAMDSSGGEDAGVSVAEAEAAGEGGAEAEAAGEAAASAAHRQASPSPGSIVISPGSATADPSSRSRSRWTKPALAGLAAAAVLVPLAISATSGSGKSSAGHPAAAPPSAATTTAAPATTSSPSPTPLPTPVSVNVLADNWDTECGQWFYTTQPPSQVPPPPGLPDVGLWAQPLGAIPGGHLRLQLTAQGTAGRAPVILHTLYVHIIGAKPAPKGGYGYTMGSGCGGGLDPASFGIDLDAADPKIKAVSGQTAGGDVGIANFPFQVSGTDTQVLDVDAHSADQEIDWNLVLVWSCGDQQGTLTVDDHGKPFRTVGLAGKPVYFYDGAKWSPTTLDQ